MIRLEDAIGNLVDEVDYRVGGDWPRLANGDGSSLELIHPDMNNDFATAWRDSDESEQSIVSGLLKLAVPTISYVQVAVSLTTRNSTCIW